MAHLASGAVLAGGAIATWGFLYDSMESQTLERLEDAFPGRWHWDAPMTPERRMAGIGGAVATAGATHALWAWGLGFVIKPSELAKYRAAQAERAATNLRLGRAADGSTGAVSKYAKQRAAAKAAAASAEAAAAADASPLVLRLRRFIRVGGPRHALAFTAAIMTAGAVKPYFEGPFCRAPPTHEARVREQMEFVEQHRRSA